MYSQNVSQKGYSLSMNLTNLETRIMKLLWKLDGQGTVNNLIEIWEEPEKPKYTTVLKILQILEKKGGVSHKKQGKAYVYCAELDKKDSIKHNVKKLISDFFGGNKLGFANMFISDNEFTYEELQELKKYIQEKEKDLHDE